jgi:hypothetical protein
LLRANRYKALLAVLVGLVCPACEGTITGSSVAPAEFGDAPDSLGQSGAAWDEHEHAESPDPDPRQDHTPEGTAVQGDDDSPTAAEPEPEPESRPTVPSGATSQAPTPAAMTFDRFGVRELYPTKPAGRQWHLPEDGARTAGAWMPSAEVTAVEPGVWRTDGDSGQVRLTVISNEGDAWWQNVEMTGYFRRVGEAGLNGQVPHLEFLVRGERHSILPVAARDINFGVTPPAGTLTWPGYPFEDAGMNTHCLGTAYHGNLYPNGRMLFEKEFSHSGGYTAKRSERMLDFEIEQEAWFGIKLVVRNQADSDRVQLEFWLDSDASGTWQRVNSATDTKGAWVLPDDNEMDGCTSEPYSIDRAAPFHWAGPWVIFRADGMLLDFKALSIREIPPA